MEPPQRPNESDCCGSGCTPCIFDVYEEQLKKYEKNKALGVVTVVTNEKNCISQTSYTSFVCVGRKQHTKNCYIFTFRSENSDCVLRYNAGQHFLLRGVDGKFTRAYTPIPPKNDDYSFNVLVKLYENGAMSGFFKNLNVGEKCFWRGPYGDYVFNHNYKHVFGVVQGTGIAPIYAIFSELIDSDTFLWLFCCFASSDFLLHDELYGLAANWNFCYEVFCCGDFTVKYNEIVHKRRLLYIDIERFLQDKSLSEIQILICGSNDFNSNCLEFLKNCNVPQENIKAFS